MKTSFEGDIWVENYMNSGGHDIAIRKERGLGRGNGKCKSPGVRDRLVAYKQVKGSNGYKNNGNTR